MKRFERKRGYFIFDKILIMKIIYSDIQKFNTIIDNFKKDWLNSLHLVSDFDRTLTKAFSAWKKDQAWFQF